MRQLLRLANWHITNLVRTKTIRMIYYNFYKNPRKEKEGPEHFHPRTINQGTADLKVLAKEIEKGTTLTAADIEATLTALTDQMVKHLLNGERIYLKGLGYFSISLRCTKTNAIPDQTRAENIRFKALNFKADKNLRLELQGITCKRCSSNTSNTGESIEVVNALSKFFETHSFITRKMMEELCNMSQTTANRRLKECINNRILKNEGTRFNPIYVPDEKFPIR